MAFSLETEMQRSVLKTPSHESSLPDFAMMQFNWLLRSLRLPEIAEVDASKAKMDGGDLVFLFGDAAHAMPIGQYFTSV